MLMLQGNHIGKWALIVLFTWEGIFFWIWEVWFFKFKPYVAWLKQTIMRFIHGCIKWISQNPYTSRHKQFEFKIKTWMYLKHYQYLNKNQEFYFRIKEELLFFFVKIKSLHCIKRSFIPCLLCGERKIFIIWYKPFFKVDKGKMIIQIRYRNFDSSWFCTKEIFAGVYVENFVPIQKRLCLSNLQDKVHWGMQFNLNQCHPMVH